MTNESVDVPGFVHLHLTRRNLETLLRKLDRAAAGEDTARTLIKGDTEHKQFPITGASRVIVTAHEDADYYTDRAPGITREFPHA